MTILLAATVLNILVTVAGFVLLGLRLRRPKSPTVAQLVAANPTESVAAAVKSQRILEEFAAVAVEAAEERYGKKNGQDKARFARQAVLDHAAAIGVPCTGIQADALVHSALSKQAD